MISSIDHLARLFEHMHWADDRVLKLLSTSPAAGTEPVRRLFHHILASERVWLLRLRGEDSGLQAIWPRLAPVEEHAMAAANRVGYRRLLERLAESDLAVRLEYRSQQGRSYRTAIGDILTHVALHGSYHRGQVARAVREAGGEPVNTDFITYARELDEPTEAGRPAEPLAIASP